MFDFVTEKRLINTCTGINDRLDKEIVALSDKLQELRNSIDSLDEKFIEELDEKITGAINVMRHSVESLDKKFTDNLNKSDTQLGDRISALEVARKDFLSAVELYHSLEGHISALQRMYDDQNTLNDNQKTFNRTIEQSAGEIKESIERLDSHITQSDVRFESRVNEIEKTIDKIDLELRAENREGIQDIKKEVSASINELHLEIQSTISKIKAEMISLMVSEIKQADDRNIEVAEHAKKNAEERIDNVFERYQKLWDERDLVSEQKLESSISFYRNQMGSIISGAIQKEVQRIAIDKKVQEISNRILSAFNESLKGMGVKQQTTIVDAIAAMINPKLPIVVEPEETIAPDANVIYHKNHDKLKSCIESGAIPMLVGPAGTGKSTAAEQIAKELGLKFYMANRIQNTFELVGFVDASGKYVTTQFFEAFTKGGLFLFDEVDASSPEALVTINAALAQKIMAFPGQPKALPMHKDFKVVCAGNTFGTGPSLEYTGRNKLDAATLDRFMIIEWGYDEQLEDIIIKDKELLRFCWVLRRCAAEVEKRVIVSTRGIKTLEMMFTQNKKTNAYKGEEIIRLKFFNTIRPEHLNRIIVQCEKEPNMEYNRYFEMLTKLKTKTR